MSEKIGLCPLCGSEGVLHPAVNDSAQAGASCANEDCILHIDYQDETNRHANLNQWPKPCVFEWRTFDGSRYGPDRVWCRVHGPDCPSFKNR